MHRLAVRAFFSFFWLLFVSLLGLVVAVFRYGDVALGHVFARIYGRVALWILGLRVEYLGRENLTLNPPCIIVANHQSGLDVPVFSPLYPRGAVIIGKKELVWIPFFGFFFKASGNIMIDRGRRHRAVATLSVAVDAIRKRGLSIFIFPEGTRNGVGHGLLPFKKGAFHMAIQAQCPVIPIVVSSYAPIFSWKRKWIARRGVVQVRVLPAVTTVGLGPDDVESLAGRVREEMLRALEGVQSRCE